MFGEFQKLDEFYKLLVASAIGGLVVKVLDVVWNQLVVEWFEKRRLSTNDKRVLADAIIALCAEADSSQYRKLPESERRIFTLINQLESMGDPIHDSLLEFYNYWIAVSILSETAQIREEKTFLKEITKDADKNRKILLRAVNKWKK